MFSSTNFFCVHRSASGGRAAIPMVSPGADGVLHDLPVYIRGLCLSDRLLPGDCCQQQVNTCALTQFYLY